MLKKLTVVALVGLLSLPVAASAGGVQPSAEELQNQIEKLTRELGQLRSQMEQLKNRPAPAAQAPGYNDSELRKKVSKLQNQSDRNQADVEALKDKSPTWDLASRFELSGDFRPRLDFVKAKTPSYYNAMDLGNGIADAFYGDPANPWAALGGDPANYTPAALSALIGQMKGMSAAQRKQMFEQMGYGPRPANTYKNDTMMTNRLRLNLRVRATENVTFKGRLAMYKVWGMENNAVDYTANNGMGGGPFMLNSLAFDGSSTRQPQDNTLRVDRAYINWTYIGGLPMWFSVGRRPSAGGPPGQLRQGLDQRMATPTAYMNYPFDGATLGYAYDSLFGIQNWPGRIRLCYGRGFEAGPTNNETSLRDVDFAGISWDVYHKGSRFLAFQSFIAHDIFNVPDNVTFPNPVEFALWQKDPGFYDPLNPNRDLHLDRKNLGDIYHTTTVYMDKHNNLNYFLALGWSRTNPKSIDELGTSLLSSFNTSDKNLEAKNGYSVYTGIRYDMPDYRLKLGLEYNYGTKNWIAFTPGNDDLYASKLATRGHVFEGYMIYHLPAGETVSRYANFFMRLGYQYYKYNYTGSGFWLGTPQDVNNLAQDPLTAQFYTPIKHMDEAYLTLDTYF